MNILLFLPDEDRGFLPAGDPRAVHLSSVLGMKPGDSFDMGIVGGKQGKGRIVSVSGKGIEIAWEPLFTPPPLHPVTLLVGMVRPIMGRRIVRDLCVMGISRVLFFPGDRGEGSYRKSAFYSEAEFMAPLVEGASQGFTTLISDVRVVSSLEEGIGAALSAAAMEAGTADAVDKTDGGITGAGKRGTAAALDNYEAAGPLGVPGPVVLPGILAIGPERGWSAREREFFRGSGFEIAHLGPRVLKAETACVVGTALFLRAAGAL